MIIKIFSIYDSKTGAYMQPFFAQTKGAALRSFSDHVNSRDPNQVSQHPEDYTLFELGDFNDESGQITPSLTPQSLGLAIEFVNKNK